MRRTTATAILLLLLGAAAIAPAARAAERLRVGGATLTRCDDDARAYCGELRRALDPAAPRGRSIGIAYRWYPGGRGAARRPAIVAVEGGPGYPSTGSIAEYRRIFGPLLGGRNLLLVDNRGTGASALIRCKAIQPFSGRSSGLEYARRVAGCARVIDRRFGRGANELFGTRYATADLAAVVRELGVRRIDLYGDSYGSFFVQSYLSRHRSRLHSVILDSTYPAGDQDPWYRSSGTAGRLALDRVCARDVACGALGGSATARLAQLVARVRLAPLTGSTRDGDGSRTTVTIGPRELADLMQNSATDTVILREYDAAVRAALAGDDAPLLRLVAQSRTWAAPGTDAAGYSVGDYVAVSCSDYAGLFSTRTAFSARDRSLAAAVATGGASGASEGPLAAGAFAPFGVAEWVGISGLSQPYDICLRWPRPTRPAAATRVVRDGVAPLPRRVPLLVVGGDLDSLTPIADPTRFAPTLARAARVVTVPNTIHVSSEGDDQLSAGGRCVRRIIRAFVVRAARIAKVGGLCGRIPPVHTAGAFPATLAAAAPATVVSGTDPGTAVRRAVTVAAGAFADATQRYWYAGAARGPALRGGSFAASGDSLVRLRLRAARFAADAPVSGAGTWTAVGGTVRATLRVTVPGVAQPVRVGLRWSAGAAYARASTGGAALSLPAP